MLIILTGPKTLLLTNGEPVPGLVNALSTFRDAGNPIGIISNNDEPAWLQDSYGPAKPQFIHNRGRQSGEIVRRNADTHKIDPHDIIVLASTPDDVQMGKNGGALVLAVGWSEHAAVRALGIGVDSAVRLDETLKLIDGWASAWWWSADNDLYDVRVLADLSTYGVGLEQTQFRKKLTGTVKQGGAQLTALLTATARSLLASGIDQKAEPALVWGVYPSAASNNKDDETLSDFTHRLRTTVSRVRMAKKGEPLFIRHTLSIKRSAAAGIDRTEPANQIETLHLNPVYKKGQLRGKHVVIVDDCTTYGVSFGVAAAFLRKAGAAKVSCVALGKFGSQLRYYDIQINSDPFHPVKADQYQVVSNEFMNGTTSAQTQNQLQTLVP